MFQTQTDLATQQATRAADVARVLSVPCCACAALAGEPCKTATGNARPRGNYHARRAVAAMRAGAR